MDYITALGVVLCPLIPHSGSQRPRTAVHLDSILIHARRRTMYMQLLQKQRR